MTMIGAAALLGSFGAAGAMNGLWASADARAHSLDGLKLAIGLPYGGVKATPKVQLSAATALAAQCQSDKLAQAHVPVAKQSLIAHVFEKPSVKTTPRLVMADATAKPQAPEHAERPLPPQPPATAESPAAPATPAPPALASLHPALAAPGSMKSLMAQAQAEASKSAKLALQSAAAASALEQARTATRVKIRLETPTTLTPAQYKNLEHELDQAVQRLEITQLLAARLNEGDFSFVVSSDDGKKTCTLGQAEGVCGLLSPADMARIRSEVAAQVKLATVAVRESQVKLARARLTDG